MREEDLPNERQEEHGVEDEFDAAMLGDDETGYSGGSLTDDVVALFEDGKTYVEAELAYQKSRAAFAAENGKWAALLGISALGLIHLALIALVVGAIIALAPIVTAFGAIAIVVGVLLAVAFGLLVVMRRHTQAIGKAFSEGEK